MASVAKIIKWPVMPGAETSACTVAQDVAPETFKHHRPPAGRKGAQAASLAVYVLAVKLLALSPLHDRSVKV